ncbi:carbonic anhydrase [Legionella santicrucis]|uniref:carbonic anhydrase n=1 Tax=Legionella santicrucis TaxID=45074 RepID=A0A0W0YUS6_9GAMM|nr:carbonic anhydrase [Legionella santicrucis]KTD60294.1 carbonic anhydrase [Legionella santicrucis]
MLIKLMLGVRQFQDESFKQMQGIFEHLSEGQKPEILFITCSDSRLMPNLLTQTKPGELFVIRNVGNIIPPSNVPSSEAAGIVFALNELDSIKDIIICGHSHCGAMKGLLTPDLKDRLPEVSSWLQHSHSVLKQMQDTNTPHSSDFALNVRQATKLNILTQLEHLKSYPLVAEKLARGELNLHGWLYEFEKGEVLVYEPQVEEFVSFEKALALAISARRDKIIEQVAMNYLESLAHPRTTKEYEILIQLFSLLEKNNLLTIWPAIKTEATQKLWAELGGLYPSIEDLQFSTLLDQGCQLKLKNLQSFQKNIMESQGYQQYIEQIMRYSLFTPPPLPLTANTPHESLNIRC